MSFDDVAKAIVDFQIKYPKKILWLFFIITILLIPGIFRLVDNVEPSLEKVLPNDINEIKTMNYVRSQFGADMLYLIVYIENPVHDVRDPEYLRYIDILSQKIETRENVMSVRSLSTLAKEANFGLIPGSLVQSREVLSKHVFLKDHVNSDYSFSLITIKTNTGSSSEIIDKTIDGIKEDIANSEEFNPGTSIQLTGFSAIDKATFSVIMSDFLVITFVSMAAIMVIVLITFRSFAKGMLPMIVVMNALIWTMGITGYLGFTITVVTMVASAMIMGLGIDFGIHQVHSFFHLREKFSTKKALHEVMKELLPAMLGASLTTMAGFLALLFGVLPAMKTLGVILALGIFTTLIGALFMLPVIIYLYDLGRTDLNKKINKNI